MNKHVSSCPTVWKWYTLICISITSLNRDLVLWIDWVMLCSVGKHTSLSQGSRNCNRHLSLKTLCSSITCHPLTQTPVFLFVWSPFLIQHIPPHLYRFKLQQLVFTQSRLRSLLCWSSGCSALCTQDLPEFVSSHVHATWFSPSLSPSRNPSCPAAVVRITNSLVWGAAFLHQLKAAVHRSLLPWSLCLLEMCGFFFFPRPCREQGSGCLQYVASAMT